MNSTDVQGRGLASIWSRVVSPCDATLSPEAARAWLALGFPTEDHARVEELNQKAQDGTLSAEDATELDDYIRVSEGLAVIKAKARLSLKKAGLSA